MLTLARHEPLLAAPDAEPSAVSVPQRVPLMMPTAQASYVFGLWRQRPEDLHDGLRGGSGRGGVLRGEPGSPPSGALVDRLAAPQTIDLSERDKTQTP